MRARHCNKALPVLSYFVFVFCVCFFANGVITSPFTYQLQIKVFRQEVAV